MSALASHPYGRIYNFSAGPCTLPVEVLEEARDGLINHGGSGLSVMEMSHRSKAYEAIHDRAIQDLRDLMGIPSEYKVLFLQGGASLQFSMVPMNFRAADGVADYVLTGAWGKKALEAARQQGGRAEVIFDGKATNYDRSARFEELAGNPDAAFTHFTSNETIGGVGFPTDPPAGQGTWVCDMSSDICSRPVDVSSYALIYAGAQKNLGPAGVTVVVMREDLLERVPAGLPPMLDYKIHVDNNSLYNTPPCWSIYVSGLVFQWMKRQGGLAGMAAQNAAKAARIYDVIDEGFYRGHAQHGSRSNMNVTFTLPQDDLTESFVKGARELGMIELKGHRSVGGCRASLYNAFPMEGCEALAAYMREFAAKHG